MDWKKEIIKAMQKFSGRYSQYTVFMDWVTCIALAIQNGCTIFQGKVWQDREKHYHNIIEKYSHDEQKLLAEMSGMFSIQLEEGEMEDVLGAIYMEAGCGNKNTGQFFTPFHVSLACAQLTVREQDVNEAHPLYFNEPSAGSGGMVIAAARALKERGINYQNCMKVVAQDLDWNCVYMTYVQLSLYGVDGIVVQGNTLTEPLTSLKAYPKERVFITPKKAGLLL